jgi:23S rRNA (adenine2503-C2)-methyltransferase
MTHHDKFLFDVPFAEWPAALGLDGGSAYRAKQVQEWAFIKRVPSFDKMTNLPQALRESLSSRLSLRGALTWAGEEVSSQDGTSRLLYKTRDRRTVSAVFLPAKGKDADEARYSLCISTQVGCAWGCVFCASGRVKYERNLTSAEIIEQVMLAEEMKKEKIGSLLFMGMGEPLANYQNVVTALSFLRSPLGLGFGARHVTVSTSGLVPQILKLAEEAPKVNLAVSLHAADDETRRQILPKSSHWTIKELLKAAWVYQKSQGNQVTFEYIMLKDVNDSQRMAQRLSNLLRYKNAWVNLIAYNPVPGLPYAASSEETMNNFAEILKGRGIFVRLRKPQGVDIQAGCGQLGEPISRRQK